MSQEPDSPNSPTVKSRIKASGKRKKKMIREPSAEDSFDKFYSRRKRRQNPEKFKSRRKRINPNRHFLNYSMKTGYDRSSSKAKYDPIRNSYGYRGHLGSPIAQKLNSELLNAEKLMSVSKFQATVVKDSTNFSGIKQRLLKRQANMNRNIFSKNFNIPEEGSNTSFNSKIIHPQRMEQQYTSHNIQLPGVSMSRRASNASNMNESGTQPNFNAMNFNSVDSSMYPSRLPSVRELHEL